ncbi:hypothetical protein [Lacinutrix jangbogonensis]|uniref:hypothetical protein n=1 Tax=Lacinutrix jangbogonensis TaxID=1469557 RepID=UPI00053CF3B3|nr:hypothetical protein [Lacinutrix jangbogonensis]
MKRFVGILIFFVLLASCKRDGYLVNGLKNISNTRNINHTFIKSFRIEKFLIQRKEIGEFSLILKLDSKTKPIDVERYSLGIRVFSDTITNKNGNVKPSYIWDCKPSIEAFGDNKYIIKNVKAPIKFIDSIRLFLYDRDKYRAKEYGKTLWIRNIGL